MSISGDVTTTGFRFFTMLFSSWRLFAFTHIYKSEPSTLHVNLTIFIFRKSLSSTKQCKKANPIASAIFVNGYEVNLSVSKHRFTDHMKIYFD